MKILNEEHLEAEQVEANAKRFEFLNSVSDDEKEKHAAVNKAVEILVAAKVPFYLFPYLEIGKDKDGAPVNRMWQWNSVSRFVKYDNGGKPTKESYDYIYSLNTSLLAVIYSIFVQAPRFQKSEGEETFLEFGRFYREALHASRAEALKVVPPKK